MDKDGRAREARGAVTERELQQILPGIDGHRASVRNARLNPIMGKPGIIRYDDLPDVLTPKEVQAFLRLGRNAIYAALQDGRIRCVRHGQKFLVPKVAVREFLDRDAEDPGAGTPVKGNA
jgi:excisionase family DNA binding protein